MKQEAGRCPASCHSIAMRRLGYLLVDEDADVSAAARACNG